MKSIRLVTAVTSKDRSIQRETQVERTSSIS